MFKKLRAVMSVEHIVQIAVSALVLAAVLPTIADNTIGIAGTKNVTGVTAILVALVPFLIVVAFVVMLTKEV